MATATAMASKSIMSWKDSGDCVVYPDGSLVKGAKAFCELQGYVYET
jgi:hypothetical protein